ncbi:uncharacterized protein AKAW2_50446A [Aspergillus luchuensis]|uniref:Uncharacterized protein n=1 Tax=Aspergillus kawachii TaxID=1069201 RepID=A0A7R7WCC6_ASPKA|nr:uncharacterized protein AKAW2_50446A [Aspergillus luchuensis]BCS00105.1 hypothetical protein AKAW2_50446A [Aspergillus luchuensis]
MQGRIPPGQFFFSVELGHAAPKAKQGWGFKSLMGGEPVELIGHFVSQMTSEHQRGILCQPNTTEPYLVIILKLVTRARTVQ